MSEVNPVRVLKGHTRSVKALALSWDGKYLASSGIESPDITVRLWDLSNGKNIATFDKQFKKINNIKVVDN